jgi:phospholipase C
MRVVAALVALALAGCGAPQSLLSPGAAPLREAMFPNGHRGSSGYISHIVLIVQENRSFDDFFATFPGADGTTTGMKRGKKVKLAQVNLISRCDFQHTRTAFLNDYDGGKMDGFSAAGCSGGANAYQYVRPSQLAPYWDIAGQYVLADHMFQTQGSGSFTAHQDLIRGGTMIDQAQNKSLVDLPTTSPWGCDAPPGTLTSLLVKKGSGLVEEHRGGPFPCTNHFPSSGKYYPTLRDLLDAQSVSWKYYSPAIGGKSSGNLWNAFDMIHPVRYGPEWTNNISSPETNIFSDISHGRLAAMSWVIPDGPNSDHPADSSDTGPSWVASVVNAIGESQYWSSTAIVIVWDDWGGFYDHEPPPLFDNWGGLGFRVPMMVVSPYARETSSSQPGYISHTKYEFGGLVKFVEANWNLGSLGTTDARAANILDCFDFTQQPRTFTPISSSYSKAYFEHQKASNRPVDTE